MLAVLDQLLMELHRFLLILDKETLSGNATVQKGLLSDLLQSYRGSNGMKIRRRSGGCVENIKTRRYWAS